MSSFYEGQVCLAGICGNISSGKSTLIEKIKSEIADRPEFMIVPEPVDEWENMIVDGKTILEAFYDDQAEMAFTFQIYALETRDSSLSKALEEAKQRSKSLGKKVVVIIERTILDDYHIFAKMLYSAGKITDFEMKVYERWFTRFSKKFALEKSIYVKVEPEVCYERVILRNRNGEEGIPLEYLKSCHRQHEAFYSDVLINHDCLTVSTKVDKESDEYNVNVGNILEHFLN